MNELSLFYIKSSVYDYLYKVFGQGDDFDMIVTYHDCADVDFLDSLKPLKFFKGDIFVEKKEFSGSSDFGTSSYRKVKDFKGNLFLLAVDVSAYYHLVKLF